MPWRKLLPIAALVAVAVTLAAQKPERGPKRYAVTNDRALVVTRDALARQGYDVVLEDASGPDIVVWYRRGSRGRGNGNGPPAKLTIHREADQVVFLQAPNAILADLDVRLRIP